jgi:hypothetical protein
MVNENIGALVVLTPSTVSGQHSTVAGIVTERGGSTVFPGLSSAFYYEKEHSKGQTYAGMLKGWQSAQGEQISEKNRGFSFA